MVSPKIIAKEMARRAMREAGAIALEQTSKLMSKAPGGLEALIERKKDELLDELIGRAEVFFQEKVRELEVRMDTKIDEYEKRISHFFYKEFASKLKMLMIVLGAAVMMSVVSIGMVIAYTF